MKKIIALTFAAVLALATIAPVLADQPPGQLGFPVAEFFFSTK